MADRSRAVMAGSRSCRDRRSRGVAGSAILIVFAGLAALSVTASPPAAAQALPFHQATGVPSGFGENAARSFLNLLGRGGLIQDGRTVADPMKRDVDVLASVTGVILGAFTPRWTVSAITPWVRKRMTFRGPEDQPLEFEVSGPGDPLLEMKWIFFSDNRERASTNFALLARAKAPLGETDARMPDGTVAPRPLQPGTGSWDFPLNLVVSDVEHRLGFHGSVGWRFNGEDDGFEGGDVFTYDAALGFRFVPWVYESLRDRTLVAYLELNGEVARPDRIDGEKNPDSGGHLLFLSPDLQWIPTPWLLFEGAVQIPVLQDLNGTQLEHDTRVQLGTRIRFSVFR